RRAAEHLEERAIGGGAAQPLVVAERDVDHPPHLPPRTERRRPRRQERERLVLALDEPAAVVLDRRGAAIAGRERVAQPRLVEAATDDQNQLGAVGPGAGQRGRREVEVAERVE